LSVVVTAASLARLILLGAIWGASFAFMRVAVPAFGPVLMIELRLALAALVLSLAAWLLARPLRARENLRHFAFVGGVNSALPFLLFAYAAQTLPASLLAVFNALAPIFGAAIAALWLGTAIGRRLALGLGLGCLGVAVLTWERTAEAWGGGAVDATIPAIGAGILAPLCYGVAGVYIKRFVTDLDPFAIAWGSMVGAALLALPFALAAPAPAAPTMREWGAVAMLGAVCTGAAYIVNFRLIADLGPARAMTVTFLIPLFGVLWGALFLDEAATPALALGGALIVAGTALAARP
jgi:drug/metabolite transporter (DMT)-like permease